MIICHCQSITDKDIRAAVDWMRASDRDTIVTAGKIYRALGKRPQCGGCVPLFVAAMRDAPGFAVRSGEAAADAAVAHGEAATRPAERDRPVPKELTGLRHTGAGRTTARSIA